MKRFLRFALVVAVVAAGAWSTTGTARADIDDASGTNTQEGNNSGRTAQRGGSASGDAVGGQVTGVVSSGRTSVDARNASRDSSVESGDAEGTNSASSFTGLNTGASLTAVGSGSAADIGGVDCTFPANPSVDLTFGCNIQDGNNATSISQTASFTSGDGVAGEVIGVVTAAGGSTSVVAANRSEDVSVETGDAGGSNAFASFTGLTGSFLLGVGTADLTDVDCSVSVGCNLQDGSNRTTGRQAATATTGDGVAGQVIGAVSAGATSIDARNSSTGVDVLTGDADADNEAAAFTGLDAAAITSVGGSSLVGLLDVTDADCTAIAGCSLQDGSNRSSLGQSARAASGDGVAGEVIGAVTSAGGSTSIVAANTSTDSDVTTGDAAAANDVSAFTGVDATVITLVGGVLTTDVSDITCSDAIGCNLQDGNNRTSSSQASAATTGDGVAGQVIGAVSAGATSIDATNRSERVSVETGNADAANDAALFTGHESTVVNLVGSELGASDVEDASCAPLSSLGVGCNLQDGSNRTTSRQSASANSGDGVAGEVIGAVTSAGGSASIVAANTSTDSDVTTGNADAANDVHSFPTRRSSDSDRKSVV